MKKNVKITKCPECPYQIFDDNGAIERYRKHWCLLKNKECLEMTIPSWCPLEDAVEQNKEN